MASVTRKPQAPTPEAQEREAAIQAVINKGLAPAAAPSEGGEDKQRQVVVFVPESLLKEVDALVKTVRPRTSRRAWLAEAIREKWSETAISNRYQRNIADRCRASPDWRCGMKYPRYCGALKIFSITPQAPREGGANGVRPPYRGAAVDLAAPEDGGAKRRDRYAGDDLRAAPLRDRRPPSALACGSLTMRRNGHRIDSPTPLQAPAQGYPTC